MGPLDNSASAPLKCEKLSLSDFKATNVEAVVLSSPNKVKLLKKRSKGDKKKLNERSDVIGSWTMVYDQGFEFTANNMKFFSYNRFIKHKKSQEITSFCAETAFGWYEMYHANNGTRSFGCYTARKVDKKKSDTVRDLPVNVKLYKDPVEHKKLNTHALSDSSTLSEATANDQNLFETESDLIQFVNKKQKLWKAGPYERFEKLTVSQMKAYGGSATNTNHMKRLLKKNIQKMDSTTTTLSDSEWASPKRAYRGSGNDWDDEVDSLSDNSAFPSYTKPRRGDGQLPESWDWRNVSGVNYVSPVRDQGACGSCYTFATLAAYEARIRILTNNQEQVILAPQDVVSCSAYNQNCSGGFPFLVGKQVNDFTLVPEDCFEYQGNAQVPCEKKCKNPRLRVTIKGDYKYIGGFYGAGNNEELMMREIYKNGPIPVSYLVYPDFKYYQNGIYSNVKAEKVVRKANKVNKFEATTHSVTVVGWGVDKDTQTKYWIAKNSWGKDWGMNGYFLIKKGVNEAAVEAQSVAPGVPVLIYQNSKH